MRELVLNRINEMRNSNDNFPKSLMRWRNFYLIDNGETNNNIHISEVKFEDLNDSDLLVLFERLVRRMSIIM